MEGYLLFLPHKILKMIRGGNFYYKDLDIIEQELKALEIIKEKRVDFGILPYCLDLETYNNAIVVNGNEWTDYKPLTQEEYELLKEVLL